MIRWLVLLVVLSGFVGNVGTNPNTLTFWWYATAVEDQDDVRDALECALVRWRMATCLPIDVSFDAHHWVRLVPASSIPGGWGYAYRQQDGSWRMKVRDDQDDDVTCDLMTHEIGHALGDSGQHLSGPYEAVMYSSYHRTNPNVITQTDINYVCAEQACACANPED